MNSVSRIFGLVLFVQLLLGVAAYAQQAPVQKASHLGKVDLELQLVDANGSASSLDTEKVVYALDWKAGKCEMRLDPYFVYCKLDTSQDLTAPDGSVLVKAMPVSHFDGAMIDGLLVNLGQKDGRTKDIIAKVVSETSAERAKGFDLPTYTCGTVGCKRDDSGAMRPWSAFTSFVAKQIEINHPALNGKKLVLKFKLHDMKGFGAAFNIVGNNNAGNFGSH